MNKRQFKYLLNRTCQVSSERRASDYNGRVPQFNPYWRYFIVDLFCFQVGKSLLPKTMKTLFLLFKVNMKTKIKTKVLL